MCLKGSQNMDTLGKIGTKLGGTKVGNPMKLNNQHIFFYAAQVHIDLSIPSEQLRVIKNQSRITRIEIPYDT